MPTRYPDLEQALGQPNYPYTRSGMTYHDIPVHTEKHRQTLSDFQRNKMLDEQIDYLLSNPMQMNYEKINQSGRTSSMWNEGQKIREFDKDGLPTGDYIKNPQAPQNIWRMHGEPDPTWSHDRPSGYWNDWDQLYGEERYAPAKSPLMAQLMGDESTEGLTVPSVAYDNWQPNWAYINALENFKEYGGDINIMSTRDAYKNKVIQVPSPGGGIMNVNLGPELTGTGGFFNSGTANMTLNPANVVKKYPTAPMGPDSEWEFLGPNEVNVNTPYFKEGDAWHTNRIVPHEAGHLQEKLDFYGGWDEPNVGAYLEGIRYGGSYSDAPRHPRMHMMDRSQWNKTDADKTLSKTQYQNFQADQARSMAESVNRDYWHDEDWDRGMAGFGGSGRSRTDDRGRPTYQSPASKDPDRSGPGRHHFDDGGIAGQWSPSTILGDEETFDIKTLGLDPGIMSIDDLEDLFEEVGLDKRIIYELINSGGLSQLVS